MSSVSDLLRQKEEPEELEEREDLTSEEAVALAKSEAEQEAHIMQILSQGRMNAKVQSILDRLPADRKGCLVRERDDDILHYEQLGYRVEAIDSVKGVHGTGDNRIRVGDLILMSTSLENFKRLQRVERTLTRRKLNLEKEGYMSNAQSNVSAAIVPFDESKEY